MSAPEDLFAELELDPLCGPEEITERMRELIDDAAPEERPRLRAAWEQLTLHPKRRVELALGTFVDLEPGPEPRPPPVVGLVSAADAPLPRALAVPASELFASLCRQGRASSEPTGYVSLAQDPILKDQRK